MREKKTFVNYLTVHLKQASMSDPKTNITIDGINRTRRRYFTESPSFSYWLAYFFLNSTLLRIVSTEWNRVIPGERQPTKALISTFEDIAKTRLLNTGAFQVFHLSSFHTLFHVMLLPHNLWQLCFIFSILLFFISCLITIKNRIIFGLSIILKYFSFNA